MVSFAGMIKVVFGDKGFVTIAPVQFIKILAGLSVALRLTVAPFRVFAVTNSVVHGEQISPDRNRRDC